MSARGGHFERAARAGVSDDIGEIGQRLSGRSVRSDNEAARTGASRPSTEPARCAQSDGQVGGAEHVDAGHERRFSGAASGK